MYKIITKLLFPLLLASSACTAEAPTQIDELAQSLTEAGVPQDSVARFSQQFNTKADRILEQLVSESPAPAPTSLVGSCGAPWPTSFGPPNSYGQTATNIYGYYYLPGYSPIWMGSQAGSQACTQACNACAGSGTYSVHDLDINDLHLEACVCQ